MLSFGMNQSWKVPIATLRVFEAAARWQSFHAAALELNLTPSAVSHSIRKMEEALRLLLFERVGRGVALSSEGQTLLGYIERGFDEILRGSGRGLHLCTAAPSASLRTELCSPMADATSRALLGSTL